MEMVADLGGAGGAVPQFVARIIFGDDCQFAILSVNTDGITALVAVVAVVVPGDGLDDSLLNGDNGSSNRIAFSLLVCKESGGRVDLFVQHGNGEGEVDSGLTIIASFRFFEFMKS